MADMLPTRLQSPLSARMEDESLAVSFPLCLADVSGPLVRDACSLLPNCRPKADGSTPFASDSMWLPICPCRRIVSFRCGS